MNRAVLSVSLLVACNGRGHDTSDRDGGTDPTPRTWECVLEEGVEVDGSPTIGCRDDFEALASDPLDASIPGARSTKTIVDRVNDDALVFTNSRLYPIHYQYASRFLSGDGLPIVPDLGSFNATEYYSPDRRFLLGAVTHYEEPDVWVYEIAPYDTASAEMITQAYRAVADNAFFGDSLLFHPTSEAIEAVARTLPADVQQISTAELFAGISYQPLNPGVAMGQLRFYRAAEVEEFVNYREIVVLDEIPNDISVVAGTITGEFQTPLAHINVLAQNRGTPNMALREAWEDASLRELEGAWVKLTVEPLRWSIESVSETEAETWWLENRPEPLDVTPFDPSIEALTDCEDVIDGDLPLSDAIAANVPVFGGKATNMAAMTQVGPDVPTPPCFAIPVHHYDAHMERHGLWERYAELTTDPAWGDPRRRAALLHVLTDDIQAAPIEPDLLSAFLAKQNSEYDRRKLRIRSSTNAEDLGNFTGAGLYTSRSGTWEEDGEDVEAAIKAVWASVWNPRAWEEREYWGIDHELVGMANLVNPSYDDERANGVAVTGNVFDTSGLEPAFYINVQRGENSVVLPEDGDTTDQLLYYYTLPGQPVVYINHSNLIPTGHTVLTSAELYELGTALDAIHRYFQPVYGDGGGFFAMDTEFKITEDGRLEVKQARPYPGWSRSE
ncbi:MAG: PEP/pyruvate-binding domain-containing protein [Myxococcota bacterium]|nr:PEP/pyruvate-binding domain-containing protein [Myxococcota bacterium]